VSLGLFRWESSGGANRGASSDAWTLPRNSASAPRFHRSRRLSIQSRKLPIGNMADNVGLTTPRGSGTSGYVQKNRSLLRPRDKVAPYPKDWEHAKHRPRQPDAEILEHEAKREVEVKVLELRDKLEDEGCVCDLRLSTTKLTSRSVDEDEIDDQCEALRRKLNQERIDGKDQGPNTKRYKSHQVHDLAKAKLEESERLRKALGISEDYEEGSHWRKQEERMRDSLAKREAEDEVKTERAREARRYKEEDSD
jgi:hypothetical protein